MGTLPVTVTSIDSEPEVKILVCKWCGREFEREGTRGPDPQYCSDGHKQRAYEARRAAIPAAGPEHDLWVAAIDIAAAPPARLRGATALVPAAQVAVLRDRLEACGIDWAKART